MYRAPILALALVFALALVAAPALASGASPPESAARVALGDRALAHYATDNATGIALANVSPGSSHQLEFAVTKGNLSSNVTVTILVSSAALGLDDAPVTIVMPREEVPVSDVWRMGALSFTVPANATGSVAYTFSANATEESANGTIVLATATGAGSIAVTSIEVPAPPIDRTPILVGVGALVLVAAVVGGFAWRQRAVRRKMNEGPRRSQVMRDLELEKKLERAKEKDPEQAVVIQQEIRQAEQVREKRREVQILEAKRADAQKTLDLLRKRHEAGGLTKLQYDNMAAKKQADLERIEAEIAQMEREDSGAAA